MGSVTGNSGFLMLRFRQGAEGTTDRAGLDPPQVSGNSVGVRQYPTESPAVLFLDTRFGWSAVLFRVS